MVCQLRRLLLTRQAEVSKGDPQCVYYLPSPASYPDLPTMRGRDQLHLEFSCAGSRMLKGCRPPRGARSAAGLSKRRKEAWPDNVFVERLWRSIKYEEAYLRAYVSGVSTDETELG